MISCGYLSDQQLSNNVLCKNVICAIIYSMIIVNNSSTSRALAQRDTVDDAPTSQSFFFFGFFAA